MTWTQTNNRTWQSADYQICGEVRGYSLWKRMPYAVINREIDSLRAAQKLAEHHKELNQGDGK